MSFGDPIVGGTVLRTPAIQSPNFVQGVQGWAIYQNGEAFFADVEITGGTLIIEGSGAGVFVYNGTPAAGTLFFSLAAAAGTDAFGNTYPAGLNILNTQSTGTISISPANAAALSPQLLFSSGVAGLTTKSSRLQVAAAGTSPNEQELLQIVGSTSTNDADASFVALILGGGNSTSNTAFAQLVFDSTTAGQFVVAGWGLAGFEMIGTTTAVEPGITAGTIVAEVWHSPSLGSGWATGSADGTAQDVQYRLDADGLVHILGSLHSTSATPASTVWTMPTAYRPSVNQRISVVEWASPSAFANYIGISTAGAVQFALTTSQSGTDYHIDVTYRLS